MITIKGGECEGFKFLEHMADVYFEAKGASLEEMFEYAALAMFETMTNLSEVEPKLRYEIKDEGFDLENTLYRWLEDLLIIHDTENMVFSKFKVHYVKKKDEGYEFYAEAWGEKFNELKHESRLVVKAVTYSLMEIKKEDNCWKALVVLDI